MRQFAYINTNQGISLYIDNEVFDLDRSWNGYESITKLLSGPRQLIATKVDEIKALAQSLINAARGIIAKATNLTKLRVENGQVVFDQHTLPDDAAQMIMRLFTEGQDIAHLEPFFENLYQNPSFRAVQNLYPFLVHGKMPITDDGHFLAYKAIRQDWKDIHSGTFDNSIGQKPEMLRNEVDENPDRTCSNGLHVCSHDYLPNFANADGHVVVVKVNPKDVVSIPRDYNNTKMRLARYEVISEVEGWYANRRHVLGATSVARTEGSTWAAAPTPAPAAYTGCGGSLSSARPAAVIVDDVEEEVEQEDDTFTYEIEALIGGEWEYDETESTEVDATDAAKELEATYRRVRVVKINGNSDADRTTIYETL